MKNNVPAFLVLLIVIFFSLETYPAQAQEYNIDSLEQVLEKSKGINKITYYYFLTDYYIYNSPDKAIKLANEFLILGEKLDSTEIVEYSYQILGEAYYFQESYDNSLNYFNKYLDTQINKNDEIGIAMAYNSLGIINRALENYPEAIKCYKRSMEINLKFNDLEGLSSTNNNLGVLHEYLNLYAQAKDYYKKSLAIGMEIDDQDRISTSYLNLGGIYLKLHDYDLAINYCNKSIELCESHSFGLTLEMNFNILYQTYKEKEDAKNSLLYLEKFYELKNKRINEESNTQIAEIEFKYSDDKKQKKIELLSKQKKQKTLLNIIILSVSGIFSILLVIFLRINKQRRAKNNALRLANTEALRQKEEIEAQRDEIEAQRDEIQNQKDISEHQTDQILKQNKDITDSIEYAKHIQIALFPDKITLQKVLKNGFCLFKPKDIVSGDFYWVAQVENKSVIVAADCTGHGVPGAFMSIIGINFLNEIVNTERIVKPNKILSELRKRIIKTMVHANRIDESKDGMDVALIVVDYDTMKLEYAGAYNHLFYIRDHMLNVIKADRMPVGISEKSIAPFTNHTIDIQKGDLFYMFSDGYADQFGGPLKKKFRVGHLRELLLEIHEKEMPEQKRALFETFINWKDKLPQVDDVLSIGIKI